MKLVNRLTLSLAFSAFIVSAAPVGVLGFGGAAEITLSTIDFAPFIPGAPYNGQGQVGAVGVRNGIFSPIGFAEEGTIVDRDADGGGVPAQPAGVPILVQDWLRFPSFSNYRIDLTFIKPGAFGTGGCNSDAIGAQCTPSFPGNISPYELSNQSDTQGQYVNAGFAVSGVIRDRATDQLLHTFTGRFGAEIRNTTIDDLLDYLAANPNNSVIAESFSGQIEATAIPEPSTFGLAGLALLAAASFGRRFSK